MNTNIMIKSYSSQVIVCNIDTMLKVYTHDVCSAIQNNGTY